MQLSTHDLEVMSAALRTHANLCRRNQEHPFEAAEWGVELRNTERVRRQVLDELAARELAASTAAVESAAQE